MSSLPLAVHQVIWLLRYLRKLATANQCEPFSHSLSILLTLLITSSPSPYSDVWAIGVITYFLLCGYTPFDRDSNLEEMQAILIADFSFTPLEYWRGVSRHAREFIKRCLTIDPTQRMTAHEALSHPFVLEKGTGEDGTTEDLLPVVKKNFNARRTLHAAIDTIRAINKLREGGAAGMMNGALSKDPHRGADSGVKNHHPQEDKVTGEGGDRMEIESRGHARGQTEEMIREQHRRVQETTRGLWSRAGA